MSRSSPTSRRSFSVPNAADHRNARRNLYEESFTYERESDMLNIDDIDHEAIQNDAELRGLSQNKSAFTDDRYDYFDEVEELVHDSEEEDKYLSHLDENLNQPETPLLSYSHSSEIRELTSNKKTNISSEINNNKNTINGDTRSNKKQQKAKTLKETCEYGFYEILRALVFLFFMVYWIIKEPIIRTVTLFTMIVSALIVDPALFIWSSLPNNENWMPSAKLRKKITTWCTLIVFSLLCIPLYKYTKPYIPVSVDFFSSKFSRPEQSNTNLMQSINLLRKEVEKSQERISQLEIHFRKHESVLGEHENVLSKHEISHGEHESVLNKLEDILNSIEDTVDDALATYHQDALNKADFALSSRGASTLVTLTSSSWSPLPAWTQGLYRFAGLPFITSSPEIAISPNNHVGECWYMYGDTGTLGISLSEEIRVKGIAIEYPSKEVINDMSSAPKDVQVFGIQDFYKNTERWFLLGDFKYDINKGESIQLFDTIDLQTLFKVVVVKVRSNWGHAEHTDLYRVRVHGEPRI
ncbi:UNC-like C-terminal-domain-containing protein [Thamnidium elegans]|nr:UNC-like C-terminal-domain-containing protein [Thamnidium elegans]